MPATQLHATHAHDHLVPVVSSEESDQIIWFVLDIATASVLRCGVTVQKSTMRQLFSTNLRF